MQVRCGNAESKEDRIATEIGAAKVKLAMEKVPFTVISSPEEANWRHVSTELYTGPKIIIKTDGRGAKEQCT
jgi:hypothetical protein